MKLNINRKKFKVGDVVYYIRNNKTIPHKFDICVGTVDEHYSTEIAIQCYTSRERRLINGIPYNDFPSYTEWKKLPKGWTYSTKLYSLEHDKFDTDEIAKTLSPYKNEDIKKAIELGIIIPVQDKQQTHIDVEIDRKLGYRLIKKSDPYDYKTPWVCKPFREVYGTYDEAKKVVKEIEDEYKRQANLSDYDWSVELIDKTLGRAVNLGYITEEKSKEIRERLLEMDNVEDIVTRVYCGNVEWKYDRNRRWIKID